MLASISCSPDDFVDFSGVGREVPIRFLDNFVAIAQPLRYDVQADSRRDGVRGEAPAHFVDGAPNTDIFEMSFHHSAEIVAILPSALGLFRSKHKLSRLAILERLLDKAT
jgi:hypothetical protein